MRLDIRAASAVHICGGCEFPDDLRATTIALTVMANSHPIAALSV